MKQAKEKRWEKKGKENGKKTDRGEWNERVDRRITVFRLCQNFLRLSEEEKKG